MDRLPYPQHPAKHEHETAYSFHNPDMITTTLSSVADSCSAGFRDGSLAGGVDERGVLGKDSGGVFGLWSFPGVEALFKCSVVNLDFEGTGIDVDVNGVALMRLRGPASLGIDRSRRGHARRG